MEGRNSQRVQYWAAWTGPIFVVTYLFFFVILGHNVSPPSLALSGPDLVSSYYIPYRSDILIGMVVSCAIGILYLPWSILLAVQMWRRESTPILTLMQLCGGILTTWLMVFCPALWAWCAKYAGTPGIDPNLIKAVHSFTWYMEDITYWITSVQLVGCGVFAILEKKIFPVWAGWIALAIQAAWTPLLLIPFFDDGVFSLAGWYNWYIVFGSWGAWFLIFSYYMFKEVARTTNIAPALGVAQPLGQGGRF